ncbi:MAG: matrixin family metalloprotease, partial [Acidobacteriia bacterium]|nr:matrixin family metalloprotease [Terriglobia bacterium]
MSGKARLRVLGAVAAAVFLGTPADAYYHYIHFLTRYVPAYEKFDLSALPNKTVSVSVANATPRTSGNDSFASVLSQVKQAAAVWNSVGSSDLRVAFAGLQAQDQVSTTPGIDVVFTDELAPGVLADAAPTVSKNPVSGPNGLFYPIVGSVVRLNNNVGAPPGPSYAETYFTTAVHELGHALGLQHTFTASAMSQGVIRDTNRMRPLDSDDIAGLSVLYGKSGWSAGFGSVSGRVTSGGAGVALASVVAMPITGSPVSALTNPDGTYRIDGIPLGSQYLLYVHPLPPDADVTPPKDGNGLALAAGGPFATLFYAAPVSVNAGQTTAGVNFNVTPRAAATVYDVVTYSYFDTANQTYSWSGNPVVPAFVNATQAATDGIGTITFRSVSMDSTPVPQTARILGEFAPAFQLSGCCAPQSVAMYFNMPRILPAVGPRHLVLSYGDDMYVLPDAINLVQKDPPVIAGATANDDGTVTITGRNLSSGSRVFFDGLPAVVKTPFSGDDGDGAITVVPPPGFGGQTATITVFSSDGQNSMTLDSVNLASGIPPATEPPTYTYPVSDSPQINAGPLALPAGSFAEVDITASNMKFVDGQVTVGFGTDDVTVRRVWVLSPTHLVVNVVVAPNAALGTSDVSVISGFQTASLPGAFQTQPRNPTLPVIASVGNGVPTQATLYPGGYGSIYGTNLTPAGVMPGVTLDDTPMDVAYASPGQINFTIPAGFPLGAATLKVDNGSVNPFPVVIDISAPPPVITGVVSSVGEAVDASHPAAAGDKLTVRVTGLDPAARGGRR